jgi:hypothetical protein
MEDERIQKRCPKCGRENPDDALSCTSCGCSLVRAPVTHDGPDVKTSKLAVVSCILGILSTLVFPVAVILNRDLLVIIYLGAAILAVLLGIVSRVCIAKSHGGLTGRGFATIGIATPVVLFLLTAIVTSLRGLRNIAFRMICGMNLTYLGMAMLIYSNDYGDKLPCAGGPNGRWVARLPSWAADNRKDAYGLSDPDATDGRATISASLYLLVKYCDAAPKMFVCRGDFGATEFDPAEYGVGDRKLTDLWDFGAEPWKHCSYSYHNPHGQYALTISSEPGMAVAADRNPWVATPFRKGKKDFGRFDPDGSREKIKAGNAVAHREDGQNVLFLDSHATFEKRSFCGVNDDNIYTYWDGGDIRRGTPPTLGSQPADPCDSLLVNDPAIPQ